MTHPHILLLVHNSVYMYVRCYIQACKHVTQGRSMRLPMRALTGL